MDFSGSGKGGAGDGKFNETDFKNLVRPGFAFEYILLECVSELNFPCGSCQMCAKLKFVCPCASGPGPIGAPKTTTILHGKI